MKVVYVAGGFDLFHIGHLRRLEKAKAAGDFLVVGVDTDEYIKRKGKESVIPYKQRREIIAALRCVDATVPHKGFEDTQGFKKYGVNIRIVGPEWMMDRRLDGIREKHCQLGIPIVVHPRMGSGISTTLIKEKIRSNG